jgi:phage baseplate assembly protein W
MIIQQFYQDIVTDFSSNMFTGDINCVYDSDVIKQSVVNLVKTTFYSRVNEPQIGSALYNSLFDFIDSITVAELDNSIKEVIQNYEPRAQYSHIVVKTDVPQKIILIDIFFTDQVTGQLQNVSVSLKRFR